MHFSIIILTVIPYCSGAGLRGRRWWNLCTATVHPWLWGICFPISIWLWIHNNVWSFSWGYVSVFELLHWTLRRCVAWGVLLRVFMIIGVCVLTCRGNSLGCAWVFELECCAYLLAMDLWPRRAFCHADLELHLCTHLVHDSCYITLHVVNSHCLLLQSRTCIYTGWMCHVPWLSV